jgi:hypothetical protein
VFTTSSEGIYKPANSVYPLSISSMLKSPYSDQVFFNPDRTWWMNYSPKGGAMDMQAGKVRAVKRRAAGECAKLRRHRELLPPGRVR